MQTLNLFGITISEQLTNNFLSITDLQEAFDRRRIEKNWNIKRISGVIETSSFIEKCYHLLKDEKNFPDYIKYKELVKSKGINSTLKELGYWELTGKGTERKTWCHELIWITIAFEMHPEILGIVLNWFIIKNSKL